MGIKNFNIYIYIKSFFAIFLTLAPCSQENWDLRSEIGCEKNGGFIWWCINKLRYIPNLIRTVSEILIPTLHFAFYLKKYPKNMPLDSEIERLKPKSPFFSHLWNVNISYDFWVGLLLIWWKSCNFVANFITYGK